jgi:hypothetical protein
MKEMKMLIKENKKNLRVCSLKSNLLKTTQRIL